MACKGCQRRKEKVIAAVTKAKTAIERIRARVQARKERMKDTTT
jgi:predicted Fe-S protein YdhL (DUF1289 family)